MTFIFPLLKLIDWFSWETNTQIAFDSTRRGSTVSLLLSCRVLLPFPATSQLSCQMSAASWKALAPRAGQFFRRATKLMEKCKPLEWQAIVSCHCTCVRYQFSVSLIPVFFFTPFPNSRQNENIDSESGSVLTFSLIILTRWPPGWEGWGWLPAGVEDDRWAERGEFYR